MIIRHHHTGFGHWAARTEREEQEDNINNENRAAGLCGVWASRGGLLGERRARSTRGAQPTSAHAPSRVSGHASPHRDVRANASVDHHRWSLRRRWRDLAGARRFTWPRWRRRLAQRLARSSGVRSERRAQQFLEVGHAGALRTAHAARLDQPLERAWLGLA